MNDYPDSLRFIRRAERKRHEQDWYHERRRRQEHRNQVAEGVTAPPTVAEIADPEVLIRTWYRLKREAGQAPGPDRVTYCMLGAREVGQLMRELSKLINSGEFRPSTARLIRIPKRISGHRVLKLRSVLFRVVAAALNEKLTPFWEARFLDGSYGFRPGRGVWDVFLALEGAITHQGRPVIAQDDVFHAFDELPIAGVMESHRQHIQEEKLLALIEVVLKGTNELGSEKGIDQGSPHSPTALNVYLHATLDTQLKQHADHPLLHRYADNLVYACNNVSEGLEALSNTQRLLQEAGLRLKGEDGPPVDLKHGGQVRVLGLVLSLKEGRVVYGREEEAWERLREGLRMAHGEADPPSVAAQAIRGWIDAGAPTFERCQQEDLMDRILRDAASVGFREMTRECIGRWIQSATDKWQAFGERHKHKGELGGTNRSAASPTTADPPPVMASLWK